MNPWITLDCELGAHPKMAALPSDAARYGWILTLLEAKKQRTPGTFASARHFRLVMGRHGRYLADYQRAGLLDERDGALLVHDWQRHQWAVAKAQQREDIPKTSKGQGEDKERTLARAVSVPVSVSTGEGVSGEGDTWTLYCGLTGATRPGPNVVKWLTQLEDRYTTTATLEAMGAAWSEDSERRTFLSRVEHRLEKAAQQAERDAESDARDRRRDAEVWRRRLESYRYTGKWEAEWGPEPVHA